MMSMQNPWLVVVEREKQFRWFQDQVAIMYITGALGSFVTGEISHQNRRLQIGRVS